MISAVNEIVDEYRARCLWFVRSTYYPATDAERWRALDRIERYGDLEGFRRARRLKRWLSPTTSAASAAS